MYTILLLPSLGKQQEIYERHLFHLLCEYFQPMWILFKLWENKSSKKN
jgi:hypothetical protein